MIAIVVLGILVIAVAGCSAWIGRHRQGDALERHSRALNALRELADHPQPIPAEPPPPPTDHVHILDERPAGAPPQRRRARRPPAKSRPAAARSRARALESRPTAADLPTRPTPVRRTEPSPPDPLPTPEPVHLPETAAPLTFDDTAPAPPSIFASRPARHTRPRFELPRIRVSARAAAVAALAAVTVVLVGTIAAVGITAGRGSSTDKAALRPRPAAAPPTTVKRVTPTTAPKPAVQFVASVTGNGTVPVATPYTLTLSTVTLPCWVSVEDSTGRAVFTGTLQPGQSQQVAGTGSLLVRLGNSPAVQISVNGAPLNMTGVGKTANVQFGPPA